MDIILALTPIFQDVLDNEDITLSPSTSALHLEEWDSLSHIQLIVAIEKKFAIKFTASEIQSFKNVGDMSASIASKIVKP